ncbi:hypothetical protein ACQFYA_12315 [Promicromonospora sp. Marseille-Q5078]
MHVLLCVGEDDDTLGHALATAWRDAAPRCVVEAVALPGPVPPAGGIPDGDGRAGAGVFVPLESLGLASATREESPLDRRVTTADLVVVHVAVLDATTLHEGRVPAAVRAAAPLAVPVVVLAGGSEVTRREWSGAGVSGLHETGTDVVAATARVARTWAPSWA